MKAVIVTGCNSGYLPFAQGLLSSLRQFDQLSDIPVHVLDFGLDSEDRAKLSPLCESIKTAEWDIEFPLRPEWEEKYPGFRGLTARPFLPRYFPEVDVLLWIDSDVWVQDPRGIHDFLVAIRKAPCVCVLEQDRSYRRYLFGANTWRVQKARYAGLYGDEIAEKMAFRPIINSGVFAMRRDAPQWEVWQTTTESGLKGMAETDSESIFVEQCAFNIVSYLHSSPLCFLPATYNWSLWEALPIWAGKLVEPSPPFDVIRNIHMTGPTKRQVHKIWSLEKSGAFHETALDFDAVQTLKESLSAEE